MNIVRNERLIKRNARIAQITMVSSLLILAGGMYLSFRYPQEVGYSLTALLVGFMLSQIGIFFSNRWGRRPRPDELLDQALKGLDSKYTLFHYTGPASHLLVGPTGLWVLLPYYQRGTITYSKGRWRQKGGNFYLKIFAQESLGRPEMEINGEVNSLMNFLKKHVSEEEIPSIQAAMVFTNPKANVEVPEEENPPAIAVPIAKLKETVRKPAKGKSLSFDKLKSIQDLLSSA